MGSSDQLPSIAASSRSTEESFGFDGTICSVCESMFRGSPPDISDSNGGMERDRLHHSTAISFRDSVNQDCRICVAIRKSINHIAWPDILSASVDSTGFTRYSLELYNPIIGHLYFKIGAQKKGINESLVSPDHDGLRNVFQLRAASSDLRQHFEAGLEDNTGSLQSLNCISKWIERAKICKNSDESKLDSNFYPTRLLKIGKDPLIPIKLCESVTEGRYATLSYCWGSGQPVKLMEDNVDRMKEVVPTTLLPRTLQDAITVTRHLNIDFLWIDSLCIIQDSTTDWESEVEKMEDVYSNSHVNIAASHASDSHGGLFVRRSPYFTRPIIVLATWDNLEPRYMRLDSANFWDERVDRAPLNKRCWVLQERLLAPRTVHFTYDQVLWESQREWKCETYPHAENLTRLSWKAVCISIGSKEEAYESWWKILDHYLKCSLSNPDDGLPAIAGIAKRIQAATGDEYLAGLWRGVLSHSLLWYLQLEDDDFSYDGIASQESSRAQRYLAPTWSWASINRGRLVICQSPYPTDTEYIEILDCNVTTLNGSPFSRVLNGYLRLQGKLYPMLAEGDRHNYWLSLISYPGYTLNVDTFRTRQETRRWTATSTSMYSPDVLPDHAATIRVFCLPIIYFSHVRACLLLAPTEKQGHYTRFGYYASNTQEFQDFVESDSYTGEAEWFESGSDRSLVIW